MRWVVKAAAAVLVSAVIGSVSGTRADEVKIPLDQLPPAVTKAVKGRFPKAVMVEAAKETDGAKVEYEVTLKEGPSKIDMMLAPDGTITVIEKQITAKDLPSAVTATLNAKYAKATLTTVEEVIKVTGGKETLEVYEVLLETPDKKVFEVKFTADGKVTEAVEKKDKP